MTYEDSQAIAAASQITSVENVSPEYAGRSQVTVGRNNTNTQIIGVLPIYTKVRKLTLSAGVFISESDQSGARKVAVLGPTVVEDLFGQDNPIGQSVRINGQVFEVIGVTTAKGGTGFQNQDDRVYVPLATAQRQLFGVKHVTSIALEAKSENMMSIAQDEVGYFLLSRHKIKDPALKDFSIISQQDILDTATSVTGTFTTMLSGVAAISLLVGGIGIMNIMLVTVTERTREIGLRKALGAKKKMIVAQFLIESVILTFAGGFFGIVLGVMGFFVYSRFTNTTFVVSPISVLLAFCVSAGIGVLFGWYPAQKAASLQPIEALRYE